MGYKEAVDYLYNLQRYGIKLGLSNTFTLMDLLGKPHQRFRTIHIAGTNGKGSTSAMMASILQASGLKVGLYTSPHLVSFTERIKVNGIPISEERVAEMTLSLKSLVSSLKSISPTFFEFTTALAFQYFAEEGVDIAVVEVGMGGRLDATNVITPIVSIITDIGYDHQEFLGSTLPEIAYEKAGIIKDRIPVVSANTLLEIMKVIEERAEEKGSKSYIFGRDFRASSGLKVLGFRSQLFDYYGIGKVFKNLELSLLGYHQVVNASLSVAASEIISPQIEIREEAIRKGLKETRWEGRLDVISENPTILLDGAHNEAGAQALRRALEDIFLPRHDSLFLMVGMMKDKDIKGFLKVLAPLAREVIVTKADYERAASVSLLLEEAERYNLRVKAIENVSDALDYAESKARRRDLICVTGSLYTIGEIKGIGKEMERLRV